MKILNLVIFYIDKLYWYKDINIFFLKKIILNLRIYLIYFIYIIVEGFDF